MNTKVVRHIIQDMPSDEDLFRGGGHERTAHSLSNAIVKFDEGDSAIGLDGSWGSGKSSVVKMAARNLAETNSKDEKSYFFFTFDIWKSQGSSFRRSYLEHFITWAKQTFPKKSYELKSIEEEIHGTIREIRTENHPILSWYGILVLTILPFLPLYYFWAKKTFDELAEAGRSLYFFFSMPFVALTIIVALAPVLAIRKLRFRPKAERQSDFKTEFSRMLLISSRQHQDHKVLQKVRERDPNDYEFHEVLRKILGIVQSQKDRVVIVLDNIDRLPKREIEEYWAQVRSVFSRSHDCRRLGKNTDITAIVPYDRKLIEESVSDTDEQEIKKGENLSSLASRELFSKTFDEVLIVAPPVLSNAREFFSDKLNQALPRQVSQGDMFRVYRIFCELLNIEGGTTTPRQIVSFVNDLSGLFELHDGKFKLPTVAVYLAHRASLIENPAILNTENGLNHRIASLADDTRLERKLAAMVFNVEEQLAFQILLDDDIASAALAESPDTLVQLSQAPGFDLRVDDVVQANTNVWINIGRLGEVIKNFSELFKTYNSDAKSHITSSLVTAFKQIRSYSIRDEEFASFMPIFEMAAEDQRGSVVAHFVSAAFEGFKKKDALGVQDGRELSYFLRTTSAALEGADALRDLRVALGQQTPPNSPEFLYGLGESIAETGFGLDDFHNVELEVSEESKYFEEQFADFPKSAILVLAQFQACGLLSDAKWLSIANASLVAMSKEQEDMENSGDLLEIVSLARRNIVKERRNEIELAAAMADGQFFRNLGEGETVQSQVAQANLLYLTQDRLGQTLPEPKWHPEQIGLQPSGVRVSDASDAFVSFRRVLEGNAELEASQVSRLAKMIIDDREESKWISHFTNDREHIVSGQIANELFKCVNPPYLDLAFFLSLFSFLNDIFGIEEVKEILSRYSGRFSRENINELNLADIPPGILNATNSLGGKQWKALHDHTETLLKSVAASDWTDHIESMDHTIVILIEKVKSSGCVLDGGEFREPLVKAVKDLLSGRIEIEASDGSLDILMNAIDLHYHENIWRTLREDISNVTASTLEVAMKLFPQLMSSVAQRGDRIFKIEKDNVIRNLLIPALEGRNRQALDIFVDMGHVRLKDFQSAAETSSTKMLEGAWKAFTDAENDRDLIRSVSEAIYGKRRTRSIFDPKFWLSNRD